MSELHGKSAHSGHSAHHAGHHHSAGHTLRADATSAYKKAFEAAQPAPGRSVIHLDIDARELDWEFKPGHKTRAWGFNGSIPGPVIQGQVGDVLEVRLTNHLPEPTAMHWHGLRIPAAMDGTDTVQMPVQPGETFTYRFRLPDAGTFWYHPHINETVQLERGLYGAVLVRADDEPQVDAERVLVLDDVRLDRKGQIKPPGGWIEKHNGREGNTRLVNGKQEPILSMAAGHIERWRIVNAASARYVLLSLGGKEFRIIGTDGGLINAPVASTEVLLAPAERVDILVGPFTEGEKFEIGSKKHFRGKFGFPKREQFATLEVGPASPSKAFIPTLLRDLEPLVTGPVSATRQVTFDWKLDRRQGVNFQINQESHHRAEPVHVGDLQVWDIVNKTPVDHPFHLHGFFFQVLEVSGKKPHFLSWDDTVNVPAGKQVRIAWKPDDRPGEWMYHCHILEHHAAGMMAHFEVASQEK
jgi:FtsP/CotA-like multicopper oxidase with cupredoxin domain